MKRVVQYTALDPLYSDIIQEYIGCYPCEIDDIQYETEESMKGDYRSIYNVYDVKVIDSSDEEWYYEHRRMLSEEGLYYGEDEDPTNEDI
jgi:hypothetical protein